MVQASTFIVILVCYVMHNTDCLNIDTYLDVWCKEPLKIIDFKSTYSLLHEDASNLRKEAQYKCALWLKHIPNKNWTSNITDFFHETFKPKLSILKISDGLEDIDQNFFLIESKLRFLDLSRNSLSYVRLPNKSKGFMSPLAMLDYLQGLDLSQNCFTNISFIKTPAVFMQDLDLSGNKLNEVPIKSLTYFPELKNLIVKQNNIMKFENVNFIFPSLDYLDISFNRLRDLKGIENFVNLRILLLSYNAFSLIDSSLLQPEIWSLKELYLDHCQIEKVNSDSFTNFPNIEKLKLDHNRIGQLDLRTFNVLKSLEYLDVSHNLLVYLDVNLFASLKKLHELDIKNNKINKLNYNALTLHSPSLKEISLMENSFDCEDFEKMLNFFEEKAIDVVGEDRCNFEENKLDIYCCKLSPSTSSTPYLNVERTIKTTEKIESLRKMINVTSYNISQYMLEIERKRDISFKLILCQFGFIVTISSLSLIFYICRQCGKKSPKYPEEGTIAKII